MPILLDSLYQDVRGIVNPYQSGFFDDFFSSYSNSASRTFFNRLIDILKDIEDSTNQQKNKEPETQLKVTDILHPFIKRVVIRIDDTGKMARPEDYGYFADLRVRMDEGALHKCLCKEDEDVCDFPNDPTALTDQQKIKEVLANPVPEYSVEIVDLKEYTDRTQSHIYQPTKRFPIAYPFTEEGTTALNNKLYFQLNPTNIGSATLLYYKQPRDCFYATTEDHVTGDNVYDPANSLQLEWDVKLQPKFAQDIAQLYSQFIDKQQLFETSNQRLTQ